MMKGVKQATLSASNSKSRDICKAKEKLDKGILLIRRGKIWLANRNLVGLTKNMFVILPTKSLPTRQSFCIQFFVQRLQTDQQSATEGTRLIHLDCQIFFTYLFLCLFISHISVTRLYS